MKRRSRRVHYTFYQLQHAAAVPVCNPEAACPEPERLTQQRTWVTCVRCLAVLRRRGEAPAKAGKRGQGQQAHRSSWESR